MRIEEGKYYRDANGNKTGPMTRWGEAEGDHVMQWEKSNGSPEMDLLWREDGTSRYNPLLVAEWTDAGPVRTVTRQEIIPGTYDGVEVGSEVTGHPQREVMVRIATDHGPMVCMDADQLERAAAVLTALAGALRDGE